MNGIRAALEAVDQSLEVRLASRATPAARFERRRHRLDILDVAAQGLLLGLNFSQAVVNTAGQPV